MKKAMKQFFKKGISGILCAAMVLTSLSIPELTAYASEPEIADEVEAAALTNEEVNEDINEVIVENDENIVEENTDGSDNGNTGSDKEKKGNGDAVGGAAAIASLSADVIGEAEPSNEADTVTVTLNYYYGETGKSLGVTIWNAGGITPNSTAGWTSSEWTLSDDSSSWDANVCQMVESGEYPGWYSIDLTIDTTVTGAGFDMHCKDNSPTKFFSCDAQWNNPGIYTTLISGDSTCAVKNWKCYAGDDLVAAIMREVTLYVYSNAGTPAIVLDANDDELKYIDGGTVTELDAISTTVDNGWNVNCYDMQKYTGHDNWYQLTFIVPDASGKIFNLYIKNDETGEYKWNKNFHNGTADSDGVDITPVFSGEVFYKEGKFYESIDLADGMTISALEAFIAEAKEYDSAIYTEGSRTTLTNAIATAQALVDQYKGNDDIDEDVLAQITAAYNALQEAIAALEAAEIPVTFYYYNDKIDEGDELGLKFWDGDDSDVGSGVSTSSGWGIWATGDAKILEAVDGHPGWYSIPIVFKYTPAEKYPGFQIGSKDSDLSKVYSFANNNYPDLKTLADGENTAYADKNGKYYYGEDLVTGLIRNVTLYVYSEDGTPYIGSASELSYIVEGADAITELEESSNDHTDGNHYYEMQSVENLNGWYSLTFSAPVPDETSGEICGLYTYDDVDSEYKLVTKFLGKDPAAGATDSVNFAPVFEGNAYYKDGDFYASPELAEGVTLKMLEDYLKKVNDIYLNGEEEYTDDSFAKFKAAFDYATGLSKSCRDDVDKNDDDYTDPDITNAYKDLVDAFEKLVEKTDATMFYYYNDSIGEDDELGLYFWDGDNSSSTADSYDDWYVWHEGDAKIMTAVEGYPGWYSIPMVFVPTPSANWPGFEIHKKSNPSTAVEIYSDDAGNYPDLETLADGNTAYADKNGKYFYGQDLVTKLMRNVTLYVYSADEITPYIGSTGELSYIDESVEDSANSVTKLTASTNTKPDTDTNYYYNMTPVSDLNGWYSLTFSAPVPDDGSDEICGLYTYADSTYTLVTKFLSEDPATGVTDSVDFSPVFEGRVYYKDGEFYADPALAEGITLKMLEDYLESDEVADIDKNGEGYYTEDSWNNFNTVWIAAHDLVNEYRASEDKKDDNYKDAAITEAYIALQDAIKNMVKKTNETMFYYFNDSIDETDELGVFFWAKSDGNECYSNADSYTDWHVWNSGDTKIMTAVEGYPGWYSIPIVFVEGRNNGFEIHKKSEPSTKVDTYSPEYGTSFPDLDKVGTAVAVKNDKYYYGKELVTLLMRNVTLYAYNEGAAPILGTTNEITAYVDESTAKQVEVSSSDEDDNVYYYNMEKAEDVNYDDWYVLRFSAPAAGENNEIGKLYTKNESAYEAIVTFMEGTTAANAFDLAPYFGKTLYYKDGGIYDSVPVTLTDLKNLISKAKTLKEEDEAKVATGENTYKHENDGGKWADFVSKIEAAELVANNSASTGSEIQTAYNDLDTAMKELVVVPVESDTITVKRVALNDDFITGADLSSYVSLRESGVVFKDREGNALSDAGFFKMLYDGGTNWVRIRVWNDPYDGNGNGYGGGNSDLAKAKIIGKLATDAGMRVLIDFHYSDFWADPSKQDAPKAWEGYTIDQKVTAVYNYTLDSLTELRNAGVDVGMVQVGNETNNGICGEKTWTNMAKIFNAGSKAVREFDKDCLVAVHFADPSSYAFAGYATKLEDENNKVDYDVFAASYYPFWHGSAEDMQSVLETIAGKGKKVMVVETSWVTTWEDGDGHSNTSPKTTQTLNYPVSVQGQADEIRDVVDKVSSIGDSAIGVFYWEPAWISPYYVYNGNDIDQSLYNKNKEAWEKYGSGWASSYAIEYDPVDAGQWYGGSAVDNQAWFDFNGQALDTAYIYSYIRTGAEAKTKVNSIANVENEIELKVNVGDDIVWPDGKSVVVTYSDGTKTHDNDGKWQENPHHVSTSVEWDEDQMALVSADKAAVFTVDGIATCTYKVIDGEEETKTETYDVTLTIEVLSTSNILVNEGFENGLSPWVIEGTSNTAAVSGDDPRSGSSGLHFWNADALNFTVQQEIPAAKLKPGIYTAGGFLQGNGASSKDVQTLYVQIIDKDGKPSTRYEKTCSLNGWLNWVNPEITNIKVSENESLIVGMEIKSTIGGAWGTIDDMYLYGKYGVNVGDTTHGTVNVSNMEPDYGEIVRIAAMPENGYYLSELSLTGEDVGKNTFRDVSEDSIKLVENDDGTTKVSITYDENDYNDTAKQLSFAMPGGTVTLDAKFESIFSSAVAIDSEDVKVTGFAKNADSGEFECADQEYTGKKIELDLELTYKGYKLTSADYTAKYKNNNAKVADGGSARAEITVTAKGKNFTGSRTLYFNIVDTKVDISKAKAKLKAIDDTGKADTYYYTGAEIEPDIEYLTDKSGNELKANDAKLTRGSDYTVYYQKNIKVGKATMTVIANSGADSKAKGSFTYTFTIAKRPIDDVSVTKGAVYTGSKVTPNVTVKYANKVLQKGKDYTVSYKDNVNVSDVKPTVKITGKGNYTGSVEKHFKITPKSIGDNDIKITADDIAENKAPKITLKNGTKKLTLNKQYKITKILRQAKGESPEETIYQEADSEAGIVGIGNKPTDKISEAGTYEVTLSGIGNGGYTGTAKVEFKVLDKEHLLSNYKIILPKTKTYTGGEIELSTEGESPELKVTNKDGSVTLKYGDEYTVSYEDVNNNKTNIKAGTATVTVKGTGAYGGIKTAKFKIAKNPMVASDQIKNSKLELPYTGYAWTPELDIYATNVDGQVSITYGVKEDTLLDKIAKKTGAVDEVPTGRLLTKGVDYTITYKKNLKPGDSASIIIKGKGNYSGTVTFDNVFTVKDVTLDAFVITVNPVEYTGKAIKPALTFVYKETGTEIAVKSGTAYGVKYKNNKDVASIESEVKPTVTITEKGLNASAKGAAKTTSDIYFTITTARIKYTSVSEVKVQTYNGKPVKPKLTIKVNGKSLKEGKDYVVTFTGNSRPNDKATARIIGIGSYSGTVTKEFVIK